MGVWGFALYSGDYALDLRSTISALLRLPFSEERFVEILRQVEAEQADDPTDPDYTTFWLVLADQFAKRGVACEPVRNKALDIIDSGQDIATLAKLGMDEAGQRERNKMLTKLRSLIANGPRESRPRKVLRKPQKFLFEVGDLVTYPVSRGRAYNPYFSVKEREWFEQAYEWKQDSWGAMVIIDRAHVFDYLAVYKPLVAAHATTDKPTAGSLSSTAVSWELRRAGTCTNGHYKKMSLETLGRVALDAAKVVNVFPEVREDLAWAAIHDISLVNGMDLTPYAVPPESRDPTTVGLDAIRTG